MSGCGLEREALWTFAAPWTRRVGGHGQVDHGADGDTIWEQVFRGGGHADVEAGGGVAASQVEPLEVGDVGTDRVWGKGGEFHVGDAGFVCYHCTNNRGLLAGWMEGLGGPQSLRGAVSPQN